MDPVSNEGQSILGWAVGALGAIGTWAWKHTHGLIKQKADVVTMDSLVARMETALSNQREDNGRIFEKIDTITTTHANFVAKTIEELGKRPTREECQVIWHRDARL